MCAFERLWDFEALLESLAVSDFNCQLAFFMKQTIMVTLMAS